MAFTEKEVFYALLHNHKTTLKSLCEQSSLSYHGIVKRVNRGTLHKMSPIEIDQMCKTLGVSYEDFYTLLEKVCAGEYPDDYPKEKIKLEVTDRTYLEDRTVVMLLTPEEAEIIEKHRIGSEKAVKKALGRQPNSDGQL